MNTILIDDELDSLESLAIEIKMYCPEVNIIGQYNDPVQAVGEIKSLKPDLVMLDIEMPKMNGFELLQSVGEIDFDVIFITAYDEYAVRAFDFNAVDYLLKPILKSKLIHALQKVKDNQSQKINELQLKALLNNLNLQVAQKMENIALPTSDGYEFININEIMYAIAESNYTWVYVHKNRKFILSRTLKEVIEIMPFPFFIRVHQSYYVNMNYVNKYIKGQGGYLIMKNNEQIPVSRSRKTALTEFLKY